MGKLEEIKERLMVWESIHYAPSFSEDVEYLFDEIYKLKAQLVEYQNVETNNYDRISTSEKELAQLSKLLPERDKEIEKLWDANTRLRRGEVERLQAVETFRENATLKNKVKDLQSTRQAFEEANDKLRNEAAGLRGERTSLRHKINSLKETHNTMVESNHKLADELNAVEENLRRSGNRVNDRNFEIDDLKKGCARLHYEVEKLRKEITRLQDNIGLKYDRSWK